MGRTLQYSQNCLAGILRTDDLGGGYRSGKMCFDGGVSGHLCTGLFRFGSAHRTTDRQYLP